MRLALAASLASLFAIGCTDDGPPIDNGETYDCTRETRADEFSVGIMKTGTAFDFAITSAAPAPPARGDNTWMVQITAKGGGAALVGGALMAKPFMPDHQHGSPIQAMATDMGGGAYEISPINLWMPGLWETTITATSGATTDQAVFRFCIPN
ncbi:MAG: FixH family protein [Proteobacteria bacterium]|nr:FixH family protein [Pseudomonadota bacterium]